MSSGGDDQIITSHTGSEKDELRKSLLGEEKTTG